MGTDPKLCEKSNADIKSCPLALRRGSPLPLGATIRRTGINFAVFSKHAIKMALVLFAPGEATPFAEFNLDPRRNRTGDIWHALIEGLDPGVEYGYRAEHSPPPDHARIKLDPRVILLDPYAKAVSGGESWGIIRERAKDPKSVPAPKPRRSLVVANDFDWGDDQPLNIPPSDSIIYELHVRGATIHPSAGVKHPGTYAGLVEKIPYFKDLGVTAVELLPVDESEEADTDRINPLTGERLLNYWGYNSICFFAPDASYAADNRRGGQVKEFKTMVKAFHAAGLEVILDVVFNHTAEGDERGPTLSFRGLDNNVYYIVDWRNGAYYNYSGCGNTLNCNHPVVRDMILDCLRYWVIEMHVDGFRFDLAAILGRGGDGSVLANPPLLEAIAADPFLGNTKIIAEAWDAAGLYQVGTFPAWGRWAEWNGKFRDDLRKFVKGEPGLVPILASRMMGSPDVYAGSGRAAYHSINFITSHDGFTLADLCAYNDKHNEQNGEDNRDGCNDNYSWNCGREGPIGETDKSPVLDARSDEVTGLRRRQIKNLAALLLLSRGCPMILGGDEFGRTQRGNNNAYCQDNELSWLDWGLAKENASLLRFFQLLIRFRKDHPAMDYGRFIDLAGEPGFPVNWHGVKAYEPDWSYESRSLAVQFSERAVSDCPTPTEIYLAANAFWGALPFELPKLYEGRKWFRVMDTFRNSPEDILDPGREILLPDQQLYEVGPRSTVVLIGK